MTKLMKPSAKINVIAFLPPLGLILVSPFLNNLPSLGLVLTILPIAQAWLISWYLLPATISLRERMSKSCLLALTVAASSFIVSAITFVLLPHTRPNEPYGIEIRILATILTNIMQMAILFKAVSELLGIRVSRRTENCSVAICAVSANLPAIGPYLCYTIFTLTVAHFGKNTDTSETKVDKTLKPRLLIPTGSILFIASIIASLYLVAFEGIWSNTFGNYRLYSFLPILLLLLCYGVIYVAQAKAPLIQRLMLVVGSILGIVSLVTGVPGFFEWKFSFLLTALIIVGLIAIPLTYSATWRSKKGLLLAYCAALPIFIGDIVFEFKSAEIASYLESEILPQLKVFPSCISSNDFRNQRDEFMGSLADYQEMLIRNSCEPRLALDKMPNMAYGIKPRIYTNGKKLTVEIPPNPKTGFAFCTDNCSNPPLLPARILKFDLAQ